MSGKPSRNNTFRRHSSCRRSSDYLSSSRRSRSVVMESGRHEYDRNDAAVRQRLLEINLLIHTIFQAFFLLGTLCACIVIFYLHNQYEIISYLLLGGAETLLFLFGVLIIFTHASIYRIVLISGHICAVIFGCHLIAKYGGNNLNPMGCFRSKQCFYWPIGAKNHLVYYGIACIVFHLLQTFIASLCVYFLEGSLTQLEKEKESLAVMESRLTVAALNAKSRRKREKKRSKKRSKKFHRRSEKKPKSTQKRKRIVRVIDENSVNETKLGNYNDMTETKTLEDPMDFLKRQETK